MNNSDNQNILDSGIISFESLQEEYRDKTEKFQILLDISIGLYKARTFKEIGKTVFDNLRKFKVGSLIDGKLSVYDAEVDSYFLVYHTPIRSEQSRIHVKKISYPCKLKHIKHFSKYAIDHKKTLLIKNSKDDFAISIDLESLILPPHSMIFIPLYQNDIFVGLLSFARTPAYTIDEKFAEFLESIGRFVAVAIEKILSERTKDKDKAERIKREKYLSAIVDIQRIILTSNLSKETYLKILSLLGKASQVSRTYIFEKHIGENGFIYSSQLAEWCRDGVSAQIDNKDLVELPMETLIPRIHNSFMKNEIISGNVKDFPYSEREMLERQDIISILLIPIPGKGGYKGFIGFDDCEKRYHFTESDLTLLRSVATILSSALERDKVQNELSLSEEKFRTLFETMELGILYQDLDGYIISANPALHKIVGFTHEQLVGRSLFKSKWKFVNEDGNILSNNEFPSAIALKTGKPVSNIIIGMLNPVDKTYHWFLVNSQPLYKPDDNNPFQVYTTIADITSLRTAEQRLRESEQNFRQLAETIDQVFWIRENDKMLYFSPAYEKIIGTSDQSYKNDPLALFRFIHPDDKERILNRINDEKNRLNGTLNVEFRIVRPDGGIRWIWAKNFPIYDEKGNIHRIAGMAHDITERKHAEEERLRLQNLESLGILAGGIAHDFNNILAAIAGRVSVVIKRNTDENAIKNLEGIEKAVERAVGLTKQLLTFAKGGEPDKSIISIRKIIQETAKFALSGSNVAANFDLKDTLLVDADKNQISQVIQNIVINAKQAMPGGGEVDISAEDFIETDARQYVKIIIKDNGVGIPEENLIKIFDPYFTSKETGTGLGLSVCHSIIARHHGKILVNSVLGVGTTFTIYLPSTTEKESLFELKDNTVHEKLNILIMDDEEPIRQILSEMLQLLGHKVDESKDGNEAIEKYIDRYQNSEEYDIVFLDLTVKGGMGGADAVKLLKKVNSNVKVIVSSGYADDTLDVQKEGFSDRLNKPYNIDQLNEVIFRVLNLE